MKIPQVGDKAYCHGHINLYGEFRITEVFKEKSVLGIKCKGLYYNFRTEKNTTEERFVRWSIKEKEFRT